MTTNGKFQQKRFGFCAAKANLETLAQRFEAAGFIVQRASDRVFITHTDRLDACRIFAATNGYDPDLAYADEINPIVFYASE